MPRPIGEIAKGALEILSVRGFASTHEVARHLRVTNNAAMLTLQRMCERGSVKKLKPGSRAVNNRYPATWALPHINQTNP